MNNLELIKFSPAKAELTELAKKYSDLKIDGIDDKEGYKIVDIARKNLKQQRVDISKYGKEMREAANAYTKEVIRQEKELIEIIEPLEKSLELMQDEIDEEKKRIKFIEDQKVKLPGRLDILASINLKVDEDEVLMMSDYDFDNLISNQKALLLAQEQERINEERRQLEEEKRKIQEEKDRIEQKEKIERDIKEAEEKARIDEKNKAIKDKEEIERKHQEELDRIKKEQEELEEKRKKEAEDKIRKEKEEQEELEKKKKWNDFLKKCGYTAETKHLFKNEKQGTKVILWKNVGEFNI